MSESDPGPAGLPGSPGHHRQAFLAQRVRVLCLASAAALGLALVAGLRTNHLLTSVIQGLGVLTCLGGFLLLRRGSITLAIYGLVGSLAAVFSVLMWLNHGLADPSLLAFSGLMLFAAMLGLPRRVYLLFLLALVVQVGVLGAANLSGWYETPVRPLSAVRVMNHALVLAVVGMVAWWLSRDLYSALDDADAETVRVRAGAEQVRYLSLHDSLTGLPNRRLAKEHFEQAALAATREGHQLAVVVLDLDHFKLVNDSMGHPVGDALLQEVAHRLKHIVRSSDTLCRFGGDEFLVLLNGLERGERAARVAAQIVETLAQPFELAGRQVTCGSSVGVALYPTDARSFDELVKRADLAMYRAKECGRNGFQFFDATLHAAVEDQIVLDADMRAALSLGGQFELAFQPQVDLRSGAWSGVEALLRWQHPGRGSVSPAQFIPLAERSGFIVPLGRWVLDEACRQAKAWRAQGMPWRVSVNVSPVQIRRGQFAHDVQAALQAHGLPPDAIELELTESLLLDDASETARTLNALADLGVPLAIDDFGTGYSNLGYLRRFQIARLKIDRSFVTHLDSAQHDAAIVRAIVQMAISLGMDTVAEGVETDTQRERLAALGCCHGQGYLWFRPMRAAAIETAWHGYQQGQGVETG